MQLNKTKKDLICSQSLRVDQRKSPKYRFDITPKNYQCFVKKQNTKQDKKKLIKSKQNLNGTAKCSEQKYTVQNEKQTYKKKIQESKGHIQQLNAKSKQKANQNRKKQLSNSPDLVKLSMNQIIYKIQKEGISSEWKQDDIRKLQDNSHPENQLYFPTAQKIWLNTQKLPIIQQHQKSYTSTEQTILSERSAHYFNSSYVQYQKMMATFHFSLNNSFSYTQQGVFPEYYQMLQKNQMCARRLFQINFQMIQKDGRTTVMIKNIPNKYSLKLLSEEIDQKHANLYDFLYLPFDFNNNCNVGYAFINFIDPQYLKQFYMSFNHQKWSKFRSQKICVLTYARLQGRNSLIDHFHNSKVLNQKQKRYRPIIKEMSKIQDLLERQRRQHSQK